MLALARIRMTPSPSLYSRKAISCSSCDLHIHTGPPALSALSVKVSAALEHALVSVPQGGGPEPLSFEKQLSPVRDAHDEPLQGVRGPGQDAAPCGQRAIHHVRRELLPVSWRTGAHPGG